MELQTQRKLNYLSETKDAIKAALIEKGQAVYSSDTFRSYADKILNMEGGPGQEWVSVAGSINRSDVEANGVQTVAHNLGVVPDIIVVSANFIQPGVASHIPGNLYFAMVMSKRMLGENAARYSQSFIYNASSGNGMNLGGSAIEGALDNGLNAIYNVTSTTFTCGNTDYPLLGVAWNWAAYAMK